VHLHGQNAPELQARVLLEQAGVVWMGTNLGILSVVFPVGYAVVVHVLLSNTVLLILLLSLN